MEVAAIISAVAACIAALGGITNRTKINQVHLLVNSRLDATLAEIDDLRKQRDRLQQKDDATSATPPSGTTGSSPETAPTPSPPTGP